MEAIANLETTCLEHLDISYAKFVTDEGFQHFEGKKLPIKTLRIQGLIGVTGLGLQFPIFAVADTLEILQAGMMDQEGMLIPEWGKALGSCFKLQSLDLSGNKNLTEEFFINHVFTVEIEDGKNKIKPGF